LSGSVSIATLSQTPSAPAPFLAALHARQAPVQTWSQHTPSTHWPLTHCDADVQAAPFALSATQWLVVSQCAEPIQSMSEAHEAPQAPFWQT